MKERAAFLFIVTRRSDKNMQEHITCNIKQSATIIKHLMKQHLTIYSNMEKSLTTCTKQY